MTLLDEFVQCYNPENRHDRKATWFDEAAPLPGPLPASGDQRGGGAGAVSGDTGDLGTNETGEQL